MSGRFQRTVKNIIQNNVRLYSMLLIIVVGVLLIYSYSLPRVLFNDPYSTLLEARQGELLSATIARDGQWRFPESDSLPDKYVKAVIAYEDKRFFSHWGIDPLSLARAIQQNNRSGKIVSGGSTITMQVIRLSRKGKSRTILEKCIELILATRLEFRYSKEKILLLYANHAPFGGNVVGIEAACWRYFGRDIQTLSWSEAALLAVLPNAPSLIHPGKNRGRLQGKRDLLLDKLHQLDIIDKVTCELAKAEEIPDAPVSLPRYARHLLHRLGKDGYAQQRVVSSIDFNLQQRVEQMLQDHHQRLKANQIHNAAALIAKVSTGEVVAYAGNITASSPFDGDEVDIITSPRSTGSILKPFLYAAMLDEGKILPTTLLHDVPTLIGGFSPKNFSKDYDGAVPANKALIRSLNIPAVNMLRNYRYEKFHALLTNIGMKTLTKAPDHYGLSLILGGAEGTLWDICGMYASMGRTLNNYFSKPSKNKYDKKDFHGLTYLLQINVQDIRTNVLHEHSYISASSVYLTFDALKDLYRPGEESGWRQFYSAKKIAWKTGTSFGFRDGWAIGITPEYVVGVWTGNADGEGRPGLTGTDAAAPILFDIFSQIENSTWFKKPQQEMEQVTICAQSGHRNSELCTQVDTLWITKAGLESAVCPYHKRIYTTANKKYRVHSACEELQAIQEARWFVLPPVQAYYFQTKNSSYQPLPPFRHDCAPAQALAAMDLIYPKPQAKVFIPRDIAGNPGYAIFQLAHSNPDVTVFWHLDGQFIGTTKKPHQFPVNPSAGAHTLTVMDDSGAYLEETFEVLSGL